MSLQSWVGEITPNLVFALSALKSIYILNSSVIFIEKRTGAPQGGTIGFVQPLANISYTCLFISAYSTWLSLYYLCLGGGLELSRVSVWCSTSLFAGISVKFLQKLRKDCFRRVLGCYPLPGCVEEALGRM